MSVVIRNMTSGSKLVVGDKLCFSSTVEQVSLTYFLFGYIACKALVESVLEKCCYVYY